MRNSITFTGHLGKDPELRYSANGVAWATMRVAVNIFGPKKSDGERDKKTIWIAVKAFRWLAENAAESLHKGAPVVVTGTIDDLDVWVDNQGVSHASMTVIAETIGVDLYRGVSTWTKSAAPGTGQTQAAGQAAVASELGGVAVGAGIESGPGDAPF